MPINLVAFAKVRRRFGQIMSSSTASLTHPTQQKQLEPMDASRTLQEREKLHAELSLCASSGVISAAAYIVRLHNNHLEEFAAHKREHHRLELELETHLRRWDSAFPAPADPEPSPEPLRPARQYGRFRDMLGSGSATHH